SEVCKRRSHADPFGRCCARDDSVFRVAPARASRSVAAKDRPHQTNSLRRRRARLPANEESILGNERVEWLCFHTRRDRNLAADLEPAWTTRHPYDLRSAD